MEPDNIDNRREAIRAVGVGLLITAIALIILPLRGGWLTYGSESAAVGSTFGGIAGPFLTLIGFALVYYTLREQARANAFQRQQTNYELANQLLEKLLKSIDNSSILFAELPKIEFGNRLGLKTKTEVDEDKLPLGFSALKLYQSQLRQLDGYFELLKVRIATLTIEQREVTINVLVASYLHWLEACYDAYAYYFVAANCDPKTVKLETILQHGAESISIINKQIIELRNMRDSIQNPAQPSKQSK